MSLFFNFRFTLTDCVFVCFFLSFFLLLYFPGTPSLRVCLPRSLLFPLLCYPLLSLLLAPSPSSVRWENWPHKKWKGLFKRNGRIMKTYYCIPRCTGCGSDRRPTAILVRLGVGGRGRGVGGRSSLSLYYFSYCLISLFSFSLTITISRFLLVFLYFCRLFISSFSLCHFASRLSSSILRRESFTTYASTSRLQYNHLWSSTGHWNDLRAVLCCTRYCLHNVWYLLCPSGSFFFPSGWWKQRGITGRAEEQWVFDIFFFDPPICHASLVVSFGLTIQQVHAGKKWTVCVKILVILKYSSLFFIPSASFFFLFFLPWLTELSCAALSVWARAALLPPRSAGPQCSILTQLTAAPTPSQWILLRLFVRTQFCFVLFEKSLVKCKREDVFFLLTDDTAQWWFKVMYVK